MGVEGLYNILDFVPSISWLVTSFVQGMQAVLLNSDFCVRSWFWESYCSFHVMGILNRCGFLCHRTVAGMPGNILPVIQGRTQMYPSRPGISTWYYDFVCAQSNITRKGSIVSPFCWSEKLNWILKKSTSMFSTTGWQIELVNFKFMQLTVYLKDFYSAFL